jgi:hypothetical protein
VTQYLVWYGTFGPAIYDTDEPYSHAEMPLGTYKGAAIKGQVLVSERAVQANEIIRLADLQGIIVMWSGSIGSIPAGWALCDGTNGTPDLRDRFIVGAGNTYAVGATGGQANIDLAHTHAAGTLANANENAHTHADGSLATDTNAANNSNSQEVQSGTGVVVAADVHSHSHSHDVTGASGAGSNHTHSISGATGSQLSSAAENRPPYYA